MKIIHISSHAIPKGKRIRLYFRSFVTTDVGKEVDLLVAIFICIDNVMWGGNFNVKIKLLIWFQAIFKTSTSWQQTQFNIEISSNFPIWNLKVMKNLSFKKSHEFIWKIPYQQFMGYFVHLLRCLSATKVWIQNKRKKLSMAFA